MQKWEANSGVERMCWTRSMAWVKRGSVAIQYSSPLGGSGSEVSRYIVDLTNLEE